MRVGIVSRTATYWPFYLAQRAGLLERAGFELTLVELGSTSAGLAALRADLSEAAFTACWEAARALPWQQVAEEALKS